MLACFQVCNMRCQNSNIIKNSHSRTQNDYSDLECHKEDFWNFIDNTLPTEKTNMQKKETHLRHDFANVEPLLYSARFQPNACKY